MDDWPGVFRPLRHHVTEQTTRVVLDREYAHRMGLAGRTAYIANCGSPCWPPDEPSPELPWCPVCDRALTW